MHFASRHSQFTGSTLNVLQYHISVLAVPTFFPSFLVFLLVLLKHFVEVVVAVLERADRHVQVVGCPGGATTCGAPVRAAIAAVLPRGGGGGLLGDHVVVGGEEGGSVARAGSGAGGLVVPVVPRENVRVGVGRGGGRRGGEQAHVAGRRVSLAVRRGEVCEGKG